MARREKKTPEKSHRFAREKHGHYVEPHWVSGRLFELERFDRRCLVWDPCCGWGRVLHVAKRAGYRTAGSDVVNRKPRGADVFGVEDFLKLSPHARAQRLSIVCNPPFHLIRQFAEHACRFNIEIVAMIMQTRRLPAAGKWLRELPHARTLFITPRPSMPSGTHISRGGKVGGGKQDYCWLIFRKGHQGAATEGWLEKSPS